jgi:hypothetical protein
MGGCDPVEGGGVPSCASCMEYGRKAAIECVYSGCQWRNFESDCVEGRDRLKVATSMWMVAFGWLMLAWVGGWARRNCGKVQTMRRTGLRLAAEALSKRHEQRTVIAGGWPIKANVFTVRIKYRMSETDGAPWLVRELTVKRTNYEALEEGDTIAVVVDKSDELFVLAESVVDAPSERFGWIVLSITGVTLVPALLVGGTTMMLDAYHCWIPPPCCDDADPKNASDTPCDGVGGSSHWSLCEAPCDQGWLTWMMMSTMFGIMLSFMIVLLRSGSGFSPEDDEEEGCSWSKAGNFCFGRGEFCGEEDPNLATLEVIKPNNPSAAPSAAAAGSDGRGNVPRIDRGLTMLDRTFRGIDGGSRHYPEKPLTEEEAEIAAAELEQEEQARQRREDAEEGRVEAGRPGDGEAGEGLAQEGDDDQDFSNVDERGWAGEVAESEGWNDGEHDLEPEPMWSDEEHHAPSLEEEKESFASPLPTYQC